jgi:hypothetical protein
MARGFGRSLDMTTLQVLLRHKIVSEHLNAFNVRFDVDLGWMAWLGLTDFGDLQTMPKRFETPDSALLALLIGETNVPGVEGDDSDFVA